MPWDEFTEHLGKELYCLGKREQEARDVSKGRGEELGKLKERGKFKIF